MSPETILLIVIFILLPLIEKVMSALRQKEERKKGGNRASPGAPQRSTRPQATRPETPRLEVEPQRPASNVPDLLTMARDAAATAVQRRRERIVVPERAEARDNAVPPLRPPVTVRRERRDASTVIRDMRNPGGLRRAMMLTAILGPCRALNPPS